MPRAQFEYDEIGNTFYYVIVSFFAVLLLPLTHFLWPSLPKRIEYLKRGCRCEGDLQKRYKKEQIKPWEKAKCVIKGIILIILWILFLLLAYKVSQLEQQYEEYDPYKILGIDIDSDVTEIKKKYRELSKTHHPDKGGDPVTFDAIVKAYKALTDEESRENWRLYGNPDGPKATTFGIALPKWIVSEQYGNWVLALYTLVFMIVLPVGVGMWWYNSIKYSADKVLLETSRLYGHFLQKTPNMQINRIIMVLAGSFEFCKKLNTEIVERESDDKEIPIVMRELKNLGEKRKEQILSLPWSIKARTLLHAYLTRITLPSEHLMTDQNYMVNKSLILTEEFLRILLQLMQWPMQRTPTIDCLENSLRIFPMMVQALWPRNSNLLQLPHLAERNLAILKRYRVNTCQDLAKLNESKRRSLLNTITSDQYEDVIYVLSMMPRLEIETKVEVQGEDDKETVTIGSVVTLKVTLTRFPLLDLEKRKEEIAEGIKKGAALQLQQEWEKSIDDNRDEEDGQKQNKRKVWEKQPKKKPKKGGKPTQKSKKAPPQKQNMPINEPTEEANTNVDKTDKKITENNEIKPIDKKQNNSDQSDDSGSESDDETVSGKNEENETSDRESTEQQGGKYGGPSSSDDDDWNEMNDELDDDFVTKKEVLLESEPTNYHEVHCPYYPGDKYEWWYVYLLERKTRKFVTLVPCKTLDKEKTLDLRFAAPSQKGNHLYTLHVRCDSYMDFDYSVDVKMEVHPAREPPQVKYHDSEDEADLQEKLDSSEGEYTEGSDSEQEK
uniref:J domain-containing protein n=1 Tax=Meloidogyne incognita TaxID=6306 RepID=A0A914L6R0_MELIC